MAGTYFVMHLGQNFGPQIEVFPMGFVLFLVFLAVPIIEIFGFIQIGNLIGVWATIGIVILTAIAGSMLLRHQGLAAMFKAQTQMMEGKLPIDQMIDGLCLGLAGALLLTPGFFTDIFGFLLFIPPFRRGFAKLIYHKVIKPRATIFTNFPPDGAEQADDMRDFQSPFGDDQGRDDTVIDGEFTDVSQSKNNQTGAKEISGKPSHKGSDSSPWHPKI